MLAIRTILHPTDFSDCSDYAFQFARAIARDYGARLVVLHVETPPPFVTPREYERALEPEEGYRRELEVKLAGMSPDYRLTDGDPAEKILDAARESSCDLIVMGTHGRTGLGRLLIGSVAEAVMRRAACPVLTLKLPAGNEVKSPEAAEMKV